MWILQNWDNLTSTRKPSRFNCYVLVIHFLFLRLYFLCLFSPCLFSSRFIHFFSFFTRSSLPLFFSFLYFIIFAVYFLSYFLFIFIPQCELHVLPISSFLLHLNVVTNANNGVVHYVFFSIILFLRLSSVQIFSSAPFPQTPSSYVHPWQTK